MRINYVNAFLGRRSSGKTFYGLELIKAYNIVHPEQKILIMDTLDHPSYNHIASIDIDMLNRWKNPAVYRIFGSNIEEMVLTIQEKMTNSLIIFEDASKYVGKLLEKNFKYIIYDSKQKNNDIIFMFHGFMATPPELFRLLDNVVLFKTGDHPERRKGDMINYEDFENAYNEIKNSSDQWPRRTIKIY
jgi:hypothetical protein